MVEFGVLGPGLTKCWDVVFFAMEAFLGNSDENFPYPPEFDPLLSHPSYSPRSPL